METLGKPSTDHRNYGVLSSRGIVSGKPLEGFGFRVEGFRV